MRPPGLKIRRLRALQLILLAGTFLFLIYMHPAQQRQNPPETQQPSWRSRRHYLDPNSTIVCHSSQCIVNYESRASRSRQVPAIRHILWKHTRVSSYFARQLKTWRDIHPNWTYVLWRDSDIRRFIAKHYAWVLDKFQSLPENIMRIDMIRYFILYHFGGVYADLDYVLVRPLDRFMKFPAVVTRETEAHSLFWFSLFEWPPRILGNPAFMMSTPGHPFFKFCTQHLNTRPADEVLDFAGPLGLSDMLGLYTLTFPTSEHPSSSVVIVPASRSFYGFPNNSFASSTSDYTATILKRLRDMCSFNKSPWRRSVNLTAYCRDVLVLDPITDPNEPVYAIHDSHKSRSSYDDPKHLLEFYRNPVDIRSVLPDIVMSNTIF